MQPSADDAREASLSRSHVRIHMDATDEVRTQPAQIPQPAGDQSTPLGRTALVASTSPPDDADAPRERRLASARSSAGASELDELDEVAAIIAEQPAEHHHEPSPYLTANVLSKITWRWLSPLLAAGAKKPLELEDLHALMPRDQAGVGLAGVKAAIKKVEGNLEKKAAETGSTTKQRGTSAMWTVMWHQFGRHYLTIQLLLFLYTGFKIVQPLMLIQLVQFVQNPDEVAWHGYVYGVAMGLGSLGQACVHHNYFFHAFRVGIDVRVALNALIFEKALTLKTTHMMRTTTGQVINLVSNDSAKAEDLCIYLPYIWNCPMEIAIVLGLLYRQVGVAAFAGFGAILFLTPMQLWFSRLFGQYRRYTVQRTDMRVKTINEILIGADVMKMMNWENSLEEKVNAVRQEEFDSISRAARLKSINQAAFFASMAVVNLVTFATMWARGDTFTPADVFGATAFFNIIKFPLCNFIPFAVERITEAKIALKRITTFLELDETVARDQKKYEAQMAEVEKANAKLAEEAREDANRFQPGSIHMRDAAFVWELVEEEEEGPATAVNGKVAENGVAETNGTNGAHANGNGAVTRENGVNGIASVSAGDSSVATPSASSGAAPSSSSSSLDPSPLQRAESNPHVSRSGLHHLNVNVQPGQLVGVIGSIGAYKSSFLAACLGEMTQTSGSMLLSGRVAYASQQSWIFADTVRNNILFGRDWDAKRYMQTIRACQLVEDIKMLPAGDQTQIGEKGVNLSGGQRARLSCARAVYGDCDVYLFDDPLAALDAVVARKLYEAVMSSSGMLAGKTRILVTHQTHLLTQAHIILLDHGGVKSQGTFDELVAQGHLKEEQRHAQRDNDSAVEEAEKKKRRKDARKRREKEKEQQEAAEKRAREGTAADHTTAAAHQSTASAAVLPGQPRSDANAIMKVESSTVGALDPRILLKLANAGGGMAKALLVLFFVMLGQAVSIYSDKWLSQWSGKSADEQAEGINAWVYIGLVGGTIVLGVVRARSFFIFILHAASQLHSRMFHAVVYSPMRFFESNPIGRMLNRFAKDQSIVDELFPLTSFDFAQCFFMVVGSLIVIGLSAPFVLIMLVPIIPLFIYVRQSFMKTSRELKRLDAVTRSPVYALFSSTLSGLMIVRSFRTESAFLASFMRKMDENTRCFVLFQMTARWFGFRLDVIAASIVVCLGLVIAGTRDSISASNAGFALSYCLQLTSLFQWCVRQSAEVETMLTSVERIVEYTELKPEGTLINAEYRPPSGWPAQGQIEFRDYKMRYRAGLDLVLKGVDLVIQPGEKVGVCGRTGAGKSSLFQSILRLVEADSGGIWIDGMEIGRLGLSDLRSNLAIIPQYPVIFSGTLRYNLDPFDRCSDAQLWAALDAVQLKKMVASLKDGLLTEMAEFGSNFSVGECQLICVGRALLKPSKILLVDEATANVDAKTDALIQTVIREKFADRTVLTIAHRLNTILDSQKIVVMAAGKVAEVGSPAELLARPPCDLSVDPGATFGLFAMMANSKKAAE